MFDRFTPPAHGALESTMGIAMGSATTTSAPSTSCSRSSVRKRSPGAGPSPSAA